MDIVFTSTAVLGSLGFIFGAGLTYVSYKFSVTIDPRVEKIIEALPNVNCGACGFAGCANYAEKLVIGETSSPSLCVPGGENTAKKIAQIMGIETVACNAPKTCILICSGGHKQALNNFIYDGISTCSGANIVAGGSKACKYGCLGYGDCTLVCPFDAIHINNNGLPEINENCTGCGKCVKTCPKNVLTLVLKNNTVNILCHSNDKGIIVRKICQTGCIACLRCVKVCPEQAIEVENFLANINYPKCNNCGKCIDVCPTKTIIKRENVVCPI
ncbi:MAG: RnfABCDGE type electron transport complex subunit B [Candidatus Firestonebacteria bacterium]|nr:RnfABCDGE type electron transport complex subunit B [Candidatus Firestonebacteria bacterium]